MFAVNAGQPRSRSYGRSFDKQIQDREDLFGGQSHVAELSFSRLAERLPALRTPKTERAVTISPFVQASR